MGGHEGGQEGRQDIVLADAGAPPPPWLLFGLLLFGMLLFGLLLFEMLLFVLLVLLLMLLLVVGGVMVLRLSPGFVLFPRRR